MPGLSSMVTAARSPAICRAKSYCGKTVATMESFPLPPETIFLGEHPAHIPAASAAVSSRQVILFHIRFIRYQILKK